MSSKWESILILPHLEVENVSTFRKNLFVRCRTKRRPMPCLVCASKCEAIYDQRKVKLRDQKIRNLHVYLEVWKKRYWCPKCKKPRTETIDGVFSGRRTTQRFRRYVMGLAKRYSSLEAVRKEARVSRGFTYKVFYEQLELDTRKLRNPWPKVIGIDEHSFRRKKGYGGTEFATLVVDHKNRRPIELVEGKTTAVLDHQLSYIPGKENVQWVSLDLCDPFKNYVKGAFPNAKMVADKFHVLRLLNPALTIARKEVTGDRRTLKIRRLIQRSRKNLDYFERLELDRFLDYHSKLQELYEWKERLHSFYRIRGYKRAKQAFIFLVDEMARSRLKAIKTLRKTLLKWQDEILGYFHMRLTNARVEGFNNVAKTIKKQAYGFRSFKNYQLRVLNACF